MITKDKKQFMDLLLLADESESMIDKYCKRSIEIQHFRPFKIQHLARRQRLSYLCQNGLLK